MKTYVYRLTNKLNDKKYIGITNDIKARLRNHKSAYGCCKRLHLSIKKHGFHNFKFEILYTCSSREEALKLETREIIKQKTIGAKGYNIISYHGVGFLGGKHTKEARQKISLCQKGKLNNFYGKSHTKEHKKYLSEIFSGEGNPNSKTWIYHNIETGEIKHVKNLKKFCKEYSLIYEALLRCKRKGIPYRKIHFLKENNG